jgi:hypothetical protein
MLYWVRMQCDTRVLQTTERSHVSHGVSRPKEYWYSNIIPATSYNPAMSCMKASKFSHDVEIEEIPSLVIPFHCRSYSKSHDRDGDANLTTTYKGKHPNKSAAMKAGSHNNCLADKG